MRIPFSMPHELSTGWIKAGFDFWRISPFMDGHAAAVLDADGTDSDCFEPFARGSMTHAGARYLKQHAQLWGDTVAGLMGARAGLKPVAEPEQGDRRFHADDWSSNGWYSLLKQSYLINARALAELVEASAFDEKDKHKLRFFTRQFIDCASPANFAATNP